MYFNKTLSFFSAAVLSLGLAACGGGNNTSSGDNGNAAPAAASNTSSASPAPAASGEDSLARIKAAGKIRIGVFGDKPPFGYVDANGKSQGFDVEIAKDMAQDLLGSPDKVEFVLTEAANRVEYLKSGKVDLILANFTKTPERAEVVDYAAPYMKVALADLPERKLNLPPNIIEKTIDSNSGLHSEYGGRKEYFIVGSEPKRTYAAEMQERGYYVPPELQQRLNGGTGKTQDATPAAQPEELF